MLSLKFKKIYTIIAVVEDLDFPLREALRKQVWWKAQEKRDNGFNVVIILITSRRIKSEIIDGILIRYLSVYNILRTHFKSNYIHLMMGSIHLKLFIYYLKLMAYNGEKSLTLTDGDVFGGNHIKIKRIIKYFFPKIFSNINVYTLYQAKHLDLKYINIISPIFPVIPAHHLKSKSKKPRILYMGHLSIFKGLLTIIKAFEALIKMYPTMELVIANNMVAGEESLIEYVRAMKIKYDGNIILKGVVNPIEELSEAWVYLYPFTQPLGTMAHPLTFYESLACGTPFVACDIGGNKENYDESYFIEPNDVDSMIKKIVEYFDERLSSEYL